MTEEWSLCRRCGAPLHPGPEATRVTVPASMLRRPATDAAPATAPHPAPLVAPSSAPVRDPRPTPVAAVAAAARNGPRPVRPTPPSAALLPRVARQAPHSRGSALRAIATRNWRRILVLAIVAVALSMSVVAVWPVLFSPKAAPGSAAKTAAARETLARDLLRTVAGGARAVFTSTHSFVHVTPATISATSYRVPVVAASKNAANGAVSMKVNSARVVTFATPSGAQQCVFARYDATVTVTKFASVHTAECRAASAPVAGWSTR